MSTDNKPIILYPREYNLRGGDARSSVKGITHDGELVTIKLRVDGAIHTVEAIPSISSFAKTSTLESRQSCLASPDNSPQKPMGILIFIRCDLEENPRDPDKNYPIYYTSRWAYVLRTGHQPLTADFRGDLPFIGLGRVVIDKRNRQIQSAKDNMLRLEKDQPEGWREAYARNEAIVKDYRSYDYHLYGYLTEQESVFADEDESALIGWMDRVMGNPEENAHHGVLFRIEVDEGVIVKELARELFPIFDTVFRRFQNGAELLSFFKSSNPDLLGIGRFNYRVMPLVRFAGKKIFKDSIRSQADFDELEQTYYLRDEPIVMPLAVRIDRLENKDLLINKIHKTGPSLGNPTLLDITGRCKLRFEGQAEEETPVFHNATDLRLIGAGLIHGGGLALASWYSADIVDPESIAPLIQQPAAEASGHFIARTESLLPAENQVTLEQPDTKSLNEEHADNDNAASMIPDGEEESALMTESLSEPILATFEEIQLGTPPVSPDQSSEVLQEDAEESLSILEREEELVSAAPSADEEGAESLFGSMPISFQHFSTAGNESPAQKVLSEVGGQDEGRSDSVVELTDSTGELSEVSDIVETTSFDNETLSSLEDILNRSEALTSPSADIETETTLPAWDAVEDAVAEELEALADESSELDAWMDEEELEEVLKESPDAYSEETEGDNPTAVQVNQEPPAVGQAVIAPDLIPAPSESPSEPTKPKKGGLASFVRSRQQK